MRKIFLFVVITAITIIFPQTINAQDKASNSSANIKTPILIERGVDYRVNIIKSYLKKHDSPMVDNANDFVYFADRYNLDWRLVLAIAGVESTYGKQIPPYSYNAWGWGVYGTNVIRFISWKDGIQTVSQGLRERYMNKWNGEDIYQIGSMYASSPHWANSVNIHLNMLQKHIMSNPYDSLALTL